MARRALSPQEIDVLDYLHVKGKAHFKEIHDFLTRKYGYNSKGVTGRVLDKLVKNGLVNRISKGEYELTNEGFNTFDNERKKANDVMNNIENCLGNILTPRDIYDITFNSNDGPNLVLACFDIRDYVSGYISYLTNKYLCDHCQQEEERERVHSNSVGFELLVFSSAFEKYGASDNAWLKIFLSRGCKRRCCYDGTNVYVCDGINLGNIDVTTVVIISKRCNRAVVVSSVPATDNASAIKLAIAYSLMKVIDILRDACRVSITESNAAEPRFILYTERHRNWVHYIPFTRGYNIPKLMDALINVEGLEAGVGEVLSGSLMRR